MQWQPISQDANKGNAERAHAALARILPINISTALRNTESRAVQEISIPRRQIKQPQAPAPTPCLHHGTSHHGGRHGARARTPVGERHGGAKLVCSVANTKRHLRSVAGGVHFIILLELSRGG